MSEGNEMNSETPKGVNLQWAAIITLAVFVMGVVFGAGSWRGQTGTTTENLTQQFSQMRTDMAANNTNISTQIESIRSQISVGHDDYVKRIGHLEDEVDLMKNEIAELKGSNRSR